MGLVYPLIYVRTVLGADLGKVKQYNNMVDCFRKTIQNGGIMSLYNGIGPSTIGIVVYRGVQFGLQVHRRADRRVCVRHRGIPLRHTAASPPDRGEQAEGGPNLQWDGRLLLENPGEGGP